MKRKLRRTPNQRHFWQDLSKWWISTHTPYNSPWYNTYHRYRDWLYDNDIQDLDYSYQDWLSTHF